MNNQSTAFEQLRVIELAIQDSCFERNLMPLFKKHLLHRNVSVGMELSIFADYLSSITNDGCIIRASVLGLKSHCLNEKSGSCSEYLEVGRGFVSEETRFVFFSKSSHVYLLIQISDELRNPIPGFGMLPIEILMYEFLPEFARKCKENDTNHSISVVFFARIQSNANDNQELIYEDYLDVIFDNLGANSFQASFPNLRNEIATFEENTKAHFSKKHPNIEFKFSNSSNGNLFQASNLIFDMHERKYPKGSFGNTNFSVLTVSSGQGKLTVSEKLAKITKQKTTSKGIFIHLICLNRPPLNATPVLNFVPENNWIVPHWLPCSFFVGSHARSNQNSPLNAPKTDQKNSESLTNSFSFNPPNPSNYNSFNSWLKSFQNLSTSNEQKVKNVNNIENESENESVYKMEEMSQDELQAAQDTVISIAPVYNESFNVSVLSRQSNHTLSFIPSTIPSPSSPNRNNNVSDINDNPLHQFIHNIPRTFQNHSSPFSNHNKRDGYCRRWTNAFPDYTECIHRDPITNWKTIITPPFLPLETDYMPTWEELSSKYKLYSYTLIPNPASLFCKPENLFQKLIEQRFIQGFQSVFGKCQEGKIFILTQADEVHILKVSNDFKSSICIDRYISKSAYSSSNQVCTNIPYSFHSKSTIKFSSSNDKISTSISLERYSSLSVIFSNSNALESFQWNSFDHLICGHLTEIPMTLSFSKKRLVLLPTETIPKQSSTIINPTGEQFTNEEFRHAGFFKFIEYLNNLRLLWQEVKFENDKVLHNDAYISVNIISDSYCLYLKNRYHASNEKFHDLPIGQQSQICLTKNSSLEEIIMRLENPETGPCTIDTKWHFKTFRGVTIGRDLVDWIMRNISDVTSRTEAVTFGQYLFDNGIIEHCLKKHNFLDGFYYYKLGHQSKNTRHLERNLDAFSLENVNVRKEPIPITKSILVNLNDKSSERINWAILHYDTIYNKNNCYHLNLNWLTCPSKIVENTIEIWRKQALQLGFYLYQVPVLSCSYIETPIICPFSIKITLKFVPNKENDEFNIYNLFIDEIFKKFGFLVDFEPDNQLIEEEIASYSFLKEPYTHRQLVHVSGTYILVYFSFESTFLMVKNPYVSLNSNDFPLFNPSEFLDFCENEEKLRLLYEKIQTNKKSSPISFIS